MRWGVLAIAMCACGHDAAVIDAAHGSGDGAPADAATCSPPVLPDAAPASAAPACSANAIPGSCLDVTTCHDTRSPTPGLCAGSASIECCTPRFADSIACDPNAAPLPNACLTEEPGDPGCPAGMAHVATFCVDRFEASLVHPDGTAWSPYVHPGTAAVRAVSLRGAVPQAYISQVEASAACTAAGKAHVQRHRMVARVPGPDDDDVPVRQHARAGRV